MENKCPKCREKDEHIERMRDALETLLLARRIKEVPNIGDSYQQLKKYGWELALKAISK